jgi:predicted hotdog family 3-hydroxylacyl-ACP dehydratase
MNDFAALLPHAGNAVMIQELVHWDEREIKVRTSTHQSADNPLRCEGRLASVHLAEYGAQSMAAHGALRARAAGGTPVSALLVSVRQFEATRNYIDDLEGPLDVCARELLGSPTGWQYEFEVWHGSERIARGRVAALAFPLPGHQAAAGSSGPG